MTIRIVLADDHPLTRKGVAACIAEEEGMQLVGEAADGDSAWNLIQQFQPDIALLDIRMPGQDGIELARRIKDSGTPTKAIMLTSFDAQQYVLAALAAGAKGFIVKSSVAVELTQCIERVMNGGVYLDEAQRWIDFMNERGISWTNWSLCDKNESSAALVNGANVNDGISEDELTESGKFVFKNF